MQHTSQEHQPANSQPAAQREARPGGSRLSAQLDRSSRQAAQRRHLEDLRAGPVQRAEGLEEEDEAGAAQLRADSVQRQDNRTGMPDGLKAGIESLSGMDMSDVRVHRNSSQPAQLNALAYAQGNEIHLGPGQEQHLPHEAWHVVQQRQGRVQATMQMAGVGVNDDVGLEKEADVMGGRAVQLKGERRQVSTPYPPGMQSAGLLPLGTKVGQRQAAVVQRVDALEAIKTACSVLWSLIKLAHTSKAAPLILNGLSALTAAIRYARTDSSAGAQFGSSLLALLVAADAAVTAVEEWRDATGEGKDLWKKRVDAIEKVTSTLITAGSLFTLPFNPTVGAAIGTIGLAGVKTLRSGYDFLANNVLFNSEPAPSKEGYTQI